MKILVGVDQLRYGDGISRGSEEMARYLLERGHEVKIVCSECTIKTNVPIITCKYNNRLRQSDIRDVLNIIKREKPDIFRSHYYPMDMCGALVNSSKIKHIMHSHGISYLNLHLSLKGIPAFIRAHTGEFLGSHCAERIISISKFQQRELQIKYRIKPEKIRTVYNSVDLLKFNPSICSDTVRERYNIHPNDVVLLCVAQADPRKGHLILLECMQKVIKEIKNIKLLLVGVNKGRTDYEKLIINKINNLGIENQVICCGLVREDIQQYYAACDIFVLATKWESFGRPFAEAMACEKPVVGFDRTAISELIIDGYNGFKIPYCDSVKMAEKIVQLAEDEEMRFEFGMNGRTFAEENFDSRKNLKKMEEVCLQVYHDK